MKARNRFISLLLGAGLLTLLAVPVWPQQYSHARIVRLSFVDGTVTVQRPDVSDWAQAPVNTPIQEGFKLSTAEKSFAEVELENGSTIRLGQLSLLEFSQLALLPSGGKTNRLALQQGYATFHALPQGEDDVYEVNTPQGRLTPHGKALFRVDLDESMERVEVFKGSVEVASNLGSWSLAKEDVLELQAGSDEPYRLTQGITQDAWDDWVSERENRGQMASSGDAPSPRLYSNDVSDLLYGWNDLSNYGMWSYVPGLGYGWMPTVGAGWAPFSLGSWCWYPGFGWMWISSEPWGWLPFHYGWWEYIPGIGWAWFPDNFGYFSPALVTWYSGPGWIGWVPRGSPRGGHNSTNPCPAGQVCGTAVSAATFQSGAAVTPGSRLPVDPIQGRLAEPPGAPPTRTGMLPGVQAQQGTPPPAHFTAVFDPIQGRYVNGPPVGQAAAPKPAPTPGTPPKESAAGGAAPGNVSAPAPVESSKPHPMAPLRDVTPRPAPTARDRSGGEPRVRPLTDASSQRSGRAQESRPVRSGDGEFEGTGKAAGGSAGGESVRSGGGGGKPSSGSGPPH